MSRRQVDLGRDIYENVSFRRTRRCERTFAFDTLSITTEGLDEVVAHRELASIKGFGTGTLPYSVADAPDQGASLSTDLPADSDLSDHTLAGGLVALSFVLLLMVHLVNRRFQGVRP